MPVSGGGDDFIEIGGPDKMFLSFVMRVQEAVDGGLKVDERAEHAAVEAAFGESGEKDL